MSKVCFLCKSSEDDELLFGKFYTKWRLSVHYYCLLLSSNLVQNGVNDTVGIFGFLEQDIRKENERTKKCRCYICKEMHANVSCCSKKCLRTFHTVCGIKNRCLSHYTDTFQSWCASHIPVERDAQPHTAEEPCSICYDEMGQYDRITSIRAPCCRNGWFHQRCVAQYAQSAGYFFKCPLCNNEDTFLPEIPRRGVFVPERDAAWELEPNAFQEQLVRPTACDAEDCKCEQGRSVDSHEWRLVICGSCGSTCRHRQCMEATPELTRAYVCQLCRPILGERVSLVEDSDDDSSEDETVSSGSSSSASQFDKVRPAKELSRPGSGESGVHCSSSSDEALVAVCRRARRNVATIASDGSDSEHSDASSVQLRRFVQQNTGKRVRRLVSDESDEGTSNPMGVEEEEKDPSEAGGLSKSGTSKHSKTDTKPTTALALSVDRSPAERVDETSGVSAAPHPDVVSNDSTSESNMSIRKPKRANGRRRSLSTSSDDTHDTRSEDGSHVSEELDDLPLSIFRQKMRGNKTKPLQKLYKPSRRRSSLGPERTTKLSADTGCNKPEDAKHTNHSNASSNNDDDGRRTRQLTRRLSLNDAGKQRSTSESSSEILPRKRAVARRPRLDSSSEQSEKREAVSDETTSSKAPRSKRRRLSREQQRHRPRIVSPPSTPPSLASETTSQQSDTGSTTGGADASEDLKHTTTPTSSSSHPTLASGGSTPNRQQYQQSILKFVNCSARKTTPSSSSDGSTEETTSPLWLKQTGRNGNSDPGKAESGTKKQGSPADGGKRAIAVKRKRSATDPPKRSRTTTEDTDGKQPNDSNGTLQGPTTSKATAANKAKKDKAQNNILNYFNRC
ncbi:peptidyl-prolyl cis-trans isomerase CYP95-like [Anopheles merus]|uniref:PHD-type domain-containing protein n=1 Tax=Anopheles merus TaxID=30066 RepID=A0A182UQY8_ANOME|nr:peptidyl-prolyl cis-trans isomerase CYP95-like [Anopheles merus]